MTITTQRLFLLPTSLDMLEAIVDENWAALSTHLGGVSLADEVFLFPEAMLWMRNYLREHPDTLDWWSYLIIHRADARLIGTGGYKGSPGPEGAVEIGYSIAPAYENQGLATEAADAMVRNAFSHEAIRAVLAHTLAEENASVAILRKLGFRFAGEIIDPTDGAIWRWELLREQ